MHKKIISFILILSLSVCAFLTGCDTEKKDKENTDYDFSVYFGNMDDAVTIDALLTEYEEKTGIKIEPIISSDKKDDEGKMESLLEDEDPPAAYAVNDKADMEYLSSGGFIADFAGLGSNVQGNSFPYIMEGYGLAYDRSIFEEIFGKDKAAKLINGLKKSEYKDWAAFVKAFDNYIKGRSNKSFSVKGKKYKFSGRKGELSQNLNGVFAVPGADSNIYGYDLMDLVTQNTDLAPWESAKDMTTEPAMQILNPALTTYINGLDLYTSYLSGEYSSGIRGDDFVNEDFYSIDKTNAMLMKGKSMFSIVDSRDYSKLETLNAKKAQTLEYMPIKMPYDTLLGGKSSQSKKMNSSLPANVAYSFYVNGKCPVEKQKKALDFLVWFSEQDSKWCDPLSVSIETYVETGDTLDYYYRPKELENWEEDIFSEKGVEQFLKKEMWTDEYKDEMKLYLTETWCDN